MNSRFNPTLLSYKEGARPKKKSPTFSRSRQETQIKFLPYQLDAFLNRSNGIECWLWGRQTGKSFTLAAWAVDRLITRPGRLVSILSNSRANGLELNLKCAEICEMHRHQFEQADLSSDFQFESMNYETRIHSGGQVGRIKVLAASPRTARGFSGDLILDEFAFHEDSTKIWEAAEPILSANRDYLCRIASTPNGRHNMFYRLCTNSAMTTRKVPRSVACEQGLQIFHPLTRNVITPAEARELAMDKVSYDQNYECAFASENMSLLSYDLISQAESEDVGFICEDQWSREALEFLNGPKTQGSLFFGVDVGRTQDWTVITVLEKRAPQFFVRAILRLRNLSLPKQQDRLAQICAHRLFSRACIDMTGLGLGLYEYSHRQFGSRINGVNFSRTVPLPSTFALEGRNAATVRIPELLALQLLRVYSDRHIKHPLDPILRDELRRPERLTSSTGQVSIAADRTSGGHADHFWSLALALHAAQSIPTGGFQVIPMPGRLHIPRHCLIG
jgi:phage FluMu gp28-like protein